MNEITLNIILCDDQPQSVATLDEYLRDYLKKNRIPYQIQHFYTPAETYEYIKSHTVHIIFMDLKYGKKEDDGILWIKKIHENFPDTLVLIITAYEQRYKEGYRVRAFRFMTKPPFRQELEENMNDCLQELNDLTTILLKQKKTCFSVPLRSVLYLEAYTGESKIYTKDKLYYDQDSLLQWEKKLSGFSFFRIHKKYLIHFNYVTEIITSSHEIILEGGIRLPVARRKWTEFLKCFMQFDVSKNTGKR